MFSRGLRIFFGVGIALVVFGLGLHAVLKFYNYPATSSATCSTCSLLRLLPRSSPSSLELCSSITRSSDFRLTNTIRVRFHALLSNGAHEVRFERMALG